MRDYCDGSATKTLPVGTYFGEVGMLLPGTQCFATVKVTAATTLLSISKADFDTVLSPSQQQRKHNAASRRSPSAQRQSRGNPSNPSAATPDTAAAPPHAAGAGERTC